MDYFDNAVHYGPNDAGASTISIALGVIGVLAGAWLFGAAYALIANSLKDKRDKNDNL